MRRLVFLATGIPAAVMLCALPAQAANVDFLGYSHGSESVTYTLTAPNTSKTGTPGAGGFTTVLNSGPSFTTYCVDLYQTLNFADAAYPNYSIVTGSLHSFANTNAAADLGRLFAAGHVVNDSKTEAAFQIAVWEIAYETTGTYKVGTGSATFTGGSAAVAGGALDLASSWLDNLGSASVAVTVLESAEHQDVVFATPVPEPETYALMLAGLGVVGLLARKRRQTGRYA